MNIIYILIGISGSGKTFLRKKLLLNNKNIKVICSDDIRFELTGNMSD